MIAEQPTSEGDDAAIAFEAMRRQLALLQAVVEGFASRQQRIEARDYAPDLGRLIERQDRVRDAINTLADRPALSLTPQALGREIELAGAAARRADHEAMESANDMLRQSTRSLDGFVAHVRTAEAQRDAIIWAVVVTMGVTALALTFGPLLAA